MKIFTIGFTKSKARDFFGRLEMSGVRHVYDTRLNRVSQLAGFAKQDDLSFFLSRIGKIDYSVEALLAPTPEMLDAYRRREMLWPEYERKYISLLEARKVEKRIDLSLLDNGCLLCSEATPEHCHRRLAADYLSQSISGLKIIHL